MKLPSVGTGSYYKKFQAYLQTVGKERFKAYTYIILTLFTVCFFGIFAIAPTLNTVSNLNRQYDDSKLIFDSLSEKLRNLEQLGIQFDKLEGSVNTIYAAIPKTARIPYLTRQIENLAKNNGLNIIKLDFGTIEIFPNTKASTMYSFIFTVGVSGDRTDVNNFLADIIKFDRIVGIERITTGTDTEKQYNMTFTGRAYFSAK